jgi:hypothetical protein
MINMSDLHLNSPAFSSSALASCISRHVHLPIPRTVVRGQAQRSQSDGLLRENKHDLKAVIGFERTHLPQLPAAACSTMDMVVKPNPAVQTAAERFLRRP